LSLYTPQVGERSPELLMPAHRQWLVSALPALHARYPALLMTDGMAEALAHPPADPDHCVFSRMSINYSADLQTQVQPCFFGGQPDCSQCGCAVTAALLWIGNKKFLGVRAAQIMETSIAIGTVTARAVRGRM
jgi:hypothetical protein